MSFICLGYELACFVANRVYDLVRKAPDGLQMAKPRLNIDEAEYKQSIMKGVRGF